MLNRLERDNEKFLYRQLLPAPPAFRPHIIKRYRDITKRAGHVAANMDLLDVTDVMTAPGVDIKRAGDDDAIILEAEKLARECRGILKTSGADRCQAFVISSGHKWPDCETEAGAEARVSDAHYWRRVLRKHYGRATERAAIGINIVHREADIYASNASIERRHQQKSRNRKLLESLLAINELGDEYTLQELAEKTVSNPKIRRCELMTRIAGMERYAKSIGYVGEFYTITCPSRFHAALSKSGERNPKYDGSTPRDGQRHLCRIWSQVRSALARKRLPFLGFRVCEPQHDGTPHWHALFFVEKEHRDQLRKICRNYSLGIIPAELYETKSGIKVRSGTGVCWLSAAGGEPGAKQYRFKAVKIDWSRGSAAGYIAKYIAKNIDGFGIDADLFGNDPARAAQRVDAWASTWGIRQFQQIGGPLVTVWRELRRLKQEDVSAEILQHVSAADAGNFSRFCELQVSDPVRVVMRGALNTDTGEIKLNKYKEPAAPRVVGVEPVGSNVVFLTRRHVWSVERKKPGFTGPWSSVNNCTGESEYGSIEQERSASNVAGGESLYVAAECSSSRREEGAAFEQGCAYRSGNERDSQHPWRHDPGHGIAGGARWQLT